MADQSYQIPNDASGTALIKSLTADLSSGNFVAGYNAINAYIQADPNSAATLGSDTLGVALVSSCATRVWVWGEGLTIPPVPLTRDLPQETTARSPAFDTRVKARFPIGTPESAMGLELQSERFQRKDWDSRPSQEHVAERYDGGAQVCNLIARIYWQSNEDGRLTAVRGAYDGTCL